MSEAKLYGLLESMVKAAINKDAKLVDNLNREFSQRYDEIFADTPSYGPDTRPLHYDRCRNSAHSLCRITPQHELYNLFFEDMQTNFKAIKKPE